MNLIRYNCTLTQAGAPSVTRSIVAKSAAQARAKAMNQFTNGLPFWTFKPRDIRVSVGGVV